MPKLVKLGLKRTFHRYDRCKRQNSLNHNPYSYVNFMLPDRLRLQDCNNQQGENQKPPTSTPAQPTPTFLRERPSFIILHRTSCPITIYSIWMLRIVSVREQPSKHKKDNRHDKDPCKLKNQSDTHAFPPSPLNTEAQSCQHLFRPGTKLRFPSLCLCVSVFKHTR